MLIFHPQQNLTQGYEQIHFPKNRMIEGQTPKLQQDFSDQEEEVAGLEYRQWTVFTVPAHQILVMHR